MKFSIKLFLNTIFSKEAIKHFFKNKKILTGEKKKMLSGDFFYAGLDVLLFWERQYCKDLCTKYNNLSPLMLKKRSKILNSVLKKIESPFLIEQPFMCDYGYNIEIGENFCSNHNLVILDSAKVTIGKNVLIGPNCSLFTSIHPLEYSVRSKGLEKAAPITIGDNVWLGGNVVILPGITIGSNSVIGAGSVVTKDIPPNSIAVGNPCKII